MNNTPALTYTDKNKGRLDTADKAVQVDTTMYRSKPVRKGNRAANQIPSVSKRLCKHISNEGKQSCLEQRVPGAKFCVTHSCMLCKAHKVGYYKTCYNCAVGASSTGEAYMYALSQTDSVFVSTNDPGTEIRPQEVIMYSQCQESSDGMRTPTSAD
jgi:hypothetical protein